MAENASSANLSGPKSEEAESDRDPQGDPHEFWKSVHADALKAAEELGNVEVIWLGPQKEDDRVQQIQLVQNTIAAGVDGIVLAPLDSHALVEPVESANAKGITVVIFDSGLGHHQDGRLRHRHRQRPRRRAGGPRLGEVLKGKGKVILLRYAVGSESTEQREKGFTDTLAKSFPGIAHDLGHGIRRADVRLGPAEGAEPGHAISGVRSMGSSARTSRARSG